MAELSPTQRDEIVRHYRAGKSYPRVAADLGLPVGAVRNVIREYLVGQAVWPETSHVTIDMAEVYDNVIKPHLQAYEARVSKRRKGP